MLLSKAADQGFTTLVTTDKAMADEHPSLPVGVVTVNDNRVNALLDAVEEVDCVSRTPQNQEVRRCPSKSFTKTLTCWR